MKQHHHKRFKVYKSGGYSEPFSAKKLRLSIERSGLPRQKAQHITEEVSSKVDEGSPTRDIYQKTFQILKQTSPLAAAQYSLKRALFELGPSGHHFETFVARYFEALGFETHTCQIFQGQWVKHEIDVVAKKNGRRILVECKFHNRIGIKNDIKIALYVKARRDDLLNGPEGELINDFYLASNTAFSLDALTYANGSKLKLLGVNAPDGNPFLEQIKSMNLYPITSLRRLSKIMKSQLLAKNLVLARDILRHRALLKRIGVSDEDWLNLVQEIAMLERKK